ncbi:MAG: hypothetical protein ABI675_01990 [Chitinophagaceae bacterium]
MKFNFLVIVFLFFSCKKDRSCEGCNNENDFKDAVILYTGPVQGDGCDWVVKTNANQHYHPDFLEPDFKINELSVKIRYELTNDEFRCGIRASVMPVIHILKIKK